MILDSNHHYFFLRIFSSDGESFFSNCPANRKKSCAHKGSFNGTWQSYFLLQIVLKLFWQKNCLSLVFSFFWQRQTVPRDNFLPSNISDWTSLFVFIFLNTFFLLITHLLMNKHIFNLFKVECPVMLSDEKWTILPRFEELF